MFYIFAVTGIVFRKRQMEYVARLLKMMSRMPNATSLSPTLCLVFLWLSKVWYRIILRPNEMNCENRPFIAYNSNTYSSCARRIETYDLRCPMRMNSSSMIPNIPETRKALDMLQLLHHRNKNQHRQAHWWKWLSMLKRCLQKLIDELQCTATKPSDTRILYMRNHLLPRCYVYELSQFQAGSSWDS